MVPRLKARELGSTFVSFSTTFCSLPPPFKTTPKLGGLNRGAWVSTSLGGQILSGVSAVTLGRAWGQPRPRPLTGLWSQPAAARGPSLWAHGVAVASLGRDSGGLHGLVRRTVIKSQERRQSPPALFS